MVSYVGGDVSSSTTSVSALAGLNWISHLAGDLAIVPWALVNTATLTQDPGLTSSANVVDTNVRGIIGTDVTSGSESGAISLNCDGANANRMSAALAIYRDCTLGQIQVLGEASGTATATHASPPITPASAGSGFVLVFMERVGSTVAPASTPGGFTKRQEFSTGGTGGTSVVVYDDLSGTHGTTTFTPASIVSQTASTSALVFLIELLPSSESHSGTLGVSGSGALTLAPIPAATGADALAGSGSLTGTAVPAIAAPAAFSGSGQLSSTAVVAASGSVNLAGSGQVSGSGTPAAAGSLGLSGSGSASDTGSPSMPGPVALAGSGTLTQNGKPATAGSTALAGAGGLSPSGSPAFTGPVALAGVGAVAGTGQPKPTGTLPLTGAGTLIGVAGDNHGGLISLTGSGALAVTGKPATADLHSFSAIGNLAAAGTPAVAGSAAYSSAGDLVAVGIAGFAGVVDLAGDGLLAGVGAPATAGALSLAGVGSLACGGVTEPASEPGHLVATHTGPSLGPANELSSRLEPSHDL